MENIGKPQPPAKGYILPAWDQGNQYRATALAYMQRTGARDVQNNNGHTYTFEEIRDAVNEYNGPDAKI